MLRGIRVFRETRAPGSAAFGGGAKHVLCSVGLAVNAGAGCVGCAGCAPMCGHWIDSKTGLLMAAITAITAGRGGAAKTGIKNGVVRMQGHWEQVIPWPRAIPG